MLHTALLAVALHAAPSRTYHMQTVTITGLPVDATISPHLFESLKRGGYCRTIRVEASRTTCVVQV